MLYHSHKQLMFVNYMPFLLMALMGVDRYFEQNKPVLMITGVFLRFDKLLFCSRRYTGGNWVRYFSAFTADSVSGTIKLL